MKALLVELLTEELPPKALHRLGDALASGVETGLRKRGFLAEDCVATAYATPRRLAVRLSGVRAATEPRTVEVKLMPVAVGLGADGRPTPALLKWWAWKDQRTVELMEKWDWDRLGDNLQIQQQGNPDLMLIQKAAWGELGYTYQP